MYRETGWSYTMPDTTRSHISFDTERFYGFSTSESVTASVRLVKRPPIPNLVPPILDPLPNHIPVSVTVNGGQPYQMVLGTPGELKAVVTFSDGTTEEKSIVKLVDPDLIPTRYFKNNDIIRISGSTVTPRKYGYCLVDAEFDGVRSKPIVVAVADKNQSGENYL